MRTNFLKAIATYSSALGDMMGTMPKDHEQMIVDHKKMMNRNQM